MVLWGNIEKVVTVGTKLPNSLNASMYLQSIQLQYVILHYL